MSLPEPILDDLRFQQDLVDEARRRIIQYCPEWTDYNLSDPGITLIELFAWMTEMMVYRLNRVPEKNHIKFLELVGTQLQSASSAQTELTFWLSTPFPITPKDDTVAVVSVGTEVATRRTEEEPEIIFTTDSRLVIVPPELTYLYREIEFQKNYRDQLGLERFKFYPFQDQPQDGDAFYLGFDPAQNISGHILQLTFKCESTEAVGIKRDDPPLRWECSIGNGEWEAVKVSDYAGEEDTTGGLNNPAGKLALYLSTLMQADEFYGREAYWVRCCLDPRPEEPDNMYTESPQINNITVHSLGATTAATHAVIVHDEILGRSTGEPDQTFLLEHRPILAPVKGEIVLVEEKRGNDWVFAPWKQVKDFSRSDRFDRHYSIDTALGQVNFGPSIRYQDGSIRQYGRIPEANRTIRISRYRYGGGVAGNTPADKLVVLKSSIPYIDRASNISRAAGGRDPESLGEAKIRAQRELRAQLRAVTPEDYEDLARASTRGVARAKCNIPQGKEGRLPPGMIEILIVPAVIDSIKAGDLSKLQLSKDLKQEVHAYLDKYRLLTTTLQIREPDYIGVQVHAEIVPLEYSRPEVVRAKVVQHLDAFINCLNIVEKSKDLDELMGNDWEGWPFGRNLYVAEIFSLIQRVAGVKHVLDVQLKTYSVDPREEAMSDLVGLDNDKLEAVTQKVLRVPADALLCSLNHEISFVDLEDDSGN